MKNRFLVMAVVSALLAVIILPSAGNAATSDTSEFSASVDAGVFSLVASGDFTAGITLSGVGQVPVVATDSAWSATSADDFVTIIDSDDTDGFHVNLHMISSASSDGDFSYTGSATGQADIPVGNFRYIANISATGDTTVAPIFGDDDSTAYTWSIITGSSTAAASTSATAYKWTTTVANGNSQTAVGATPSEYFTSTMNVPVKGTLRIDKFILSVPAFSSEGAYTSTLQITAVAGN